ncbi:MAG: hypothetical protein E7526_07190 [Ruminococcaceae bacterium]|nr:hypothetical protein [Oscillospiraceae bacterium]
MQKEILTREIIKSDLKRRMKKGIFVVSTIYIIILPLYALLIYFSKKWEICSDFVWFAFIILFIVLLCASLFRLYWVHLLVLAVKKDKYKLEKEKLNNIKELFYTHGSGIMEFENCGNFWLFFSKRLKYQIPLENYHWSNTYNMTDKGVCNYSTIGDEFYLVVIGKRFVVAVYNTKLFQLDN